MSKKKILWVDDDQELTMSLKLNLENEGWQVDTATSAEQGKSVAVEDKPDLIIMDIIMEGEHGYKAISDLLSKSKLSDVPVIVFSSITERWGETTASRQDALLSEAAEFVDKTAGIDQLIRTIHNHIEN
ncbi:MAG: response regulator [Planctomycetota bacterium]|jgi:DNA-binding response OmpR family regulator